MEESILDKDNASDGYGEEEAPDQQQEEPPTDSTHQPSVTEHNAIVPDDSDVKLIRSEERHLRKEVQKMDGILKEVLTDEKETGEKGEAAVVTAEKNSGPEESKKLD